MSKKSSFCKNILRKRPVLEYIRCDGPDKKQHVHRYPEFVFLTGGSGRFEAFDNQYPIRSGDLMICGKDVSHSEYLFDNPDSEIYHLGFSGTLLSGMKEDEVIKEPFCIIHTSEQSEMLKAFFRAIQDEYTSPGACSKMIVDDLMRVLLLCVVRLAVSDIALAYSSNKSFVAAKEYFDKNFATIETIEDVCEELEINKYYLTHIFKENLGVPPVKYLLGKRMERAKSMLANSPTAVREIALRCGYADSAYFCRVFKKSEGMTPLDYRYSVKENLKDKHNS